MNSFIHILLLILLFVTLSQQKSIKEILSLHNTTSPPHQFLIDRELTSWNPGLARLSQSTFRINVDPTARRSYLGTGFLCFFTVARAQNVGTHYGFMTNSHVIPWDLLVPTVGTKLEFEFNSAIKPRTIEISLHRDTVGWFSEMPIDAAFFELRSDIIQIFKSQNYEFLPLRPNRTAEEDVGREVGIFGYPWWQSGASFSKGNILKPFLYPFAFNANFDGRKGMSGSPVFDAKTFQIMGIYRAKQTIASLADILEKIELNGLNAPLSDPPTFGWKKVLAINELTPRLNAACKKGVLADVKAIIEEFRNRSDIKPFENGPLGVLVNRLHMNNDDRELPVTMAAIRSHLEVVEYLIQDCGAEVLERYPDYNPPFHAAIRANREEAAKLIIRLRPDVLEFKNLWGQTALHLAAELGYVNLIKFLVEEKGAKIDAIDGEGQTPLFTAISNGNSEEVVKYLLEKGADPKIAAANGETPLHIAVSKNLAAISQALLEANEDLVNVLNAQNETALHRACLLESSTMAETLVDPWKADVNLKSVKGQTPLLVAASAGNLKLVEFLLEKGANLDVTDRDGGSVLHLATRSGNDDLIKYLMTKKPEMMKWENSNGETPVDVDKKLFDKLKQL